MIARISTLVLVAALSATEGRAQPSDQVVSQSGTVVLSGYVYNADGSRSPLKDVPFSVLTADGEVFASAKFDPRGTAAVFIPEAQDFWVRLDGVAEKLYLNPGYRIQSRKQQIDLVDLYWQPRPRRTQSPLIRCPGGGTPVKALLHIPWLQAHPLAVTVASETACVVTIDPVRSRLVAPRIPSTTGLLAALEVRATTLDDTPLVVDPDLSITLDSYRTQGRDFSHVTSYTAAAAYLPLSGSAKVSQSASFDPSTNELSARVPSEVAVPGHGIVLLVGNPGPGEFRNSSDGPVFVPAAESSGRPKLTATWSIVPMPSSCTLLGAASMACGTLADTGAQDGAGIIDHSVAIGALEPSQFEEAFALANGSTIAEELGDGAPASISTLMAMTKLSGTLCSSIGPGPLSDYGIPATLVESDSGVLALRLSYPGLNQPGLQVASSTYPCVAASGNTVGLRDRGQVLIEFSIGDKVGSFLAGPPLWIRTRRGYDWDLWQLDTTCPDCQSATMISAKPQPLCIPDR